MPTHRDTVRSNRSEKFRRAQDLGIDLDAERSKTGSTQRSMAFEAGKLINDPTPRQTRERLQIDDPPTGAFNGVNTTFTLSAPVVGGNIGVTWGDSTTPQTLPLVKTNTNPPASGEFFFDINVPTIIIVGNPPQPADRLVATFVVKR